MDNGKMETNSLRPLSIKQEIDCMEDLRRTENKTNDDGDSARYPVCSAWPTNSTKHESEESEQLVNKYEETREHKASIKVLYTDDVVAEQEYYTEDLGSFSIKQESLCIEDIKVEVDEVGSGDETSTNFVVPESSSWPFTENLQILEHVSYMYGETKPQMYQQNNTDGNVKCRLFMNVSHKHEVITDQCEETSKDNTKDTELNAHQNIKYHGIHKCQYCDYTAAWMSRLSEHIKAKHSVNGDAYRCTLCDYRCKWKGSLWRHVNLKHNPNAKLYKCGTCHYKTKNKSNLHTHCKLKHSKHENSNLGSNVDAKVYKCTLCDYKAKTIHNLKAHVKAKHDSSVHKCACCDYTTTNVFCLNSHVKIMHNPNATVYECAMCNYETKNRSNLHKHFQRRHNNCNESKLEHTPPISESSKSPLNRTEQDSNKEEQSELCINMSPKYDTVNDKSEVYTEQIDNSVVSQHHSVNKDKTDITKSSTVNSIACKDINENKHKCDYREYTSKWKSTIWKHVDAKRNLNFKIYKCNFCTFATKTWYCFNTHIKLKHDVNTNVYKCKCCDYATKRLYYLNAHVKLCHNTESKVFKSSKSLLELTGYMPEEVKLQMKHETNSDKEVDLCEDIDKHNVGGGVYECRFCDYTSKWKSNVGRHVDAKHNPNTEVYKCNLCEFATKTRNYFNTHIKLEHNLNAIPKRSKLHKCRFCDYTTTVKSSLNKHASIEHNMSDGYKCTWCDYKCNSKGSLWTHVNANHSSKANIYKCTLCDYRGKTIDNLNAHVKAKHDSSVHKCACCDYTTTNVFCLNSHVKLMHNLNVTMYKCATCNYETKCRSSLHRHFQLRHNKCKTSNLKLPIPEKVKLPVTRKKNSVEEKNTKLDIFSDETDNSVVSQHQETCDNKTEGTNSKPVYKKHKCQYCQYTAKWKYLLRLHIQSKHDVNAEVYKCNFCNYTTKIVYYLNSHIKLRHNPNPNVYKCATCKYTTKDRWHLYRHFKKWHYEGVKPKIEHTQPMSQQSELPVGS